MSSPDLQPCQPAEYKYYAEERVWEGSLSAGSYMLMLMLKSGSASRFFKCPSLVDTVSEAEDSSGLRTVKYKLLDTNLMPVLSRIDPFDDGYLSMTSGGVDSKSYFIGNGDVGGHDDEAERGLQEMVASQSLSPAGGQVWPRH